MTHPNERGRRAQGLCAVLFLGLAIACGCARAQDPVEPQAVVVERVRDPAMVPYRRGYEISRRVQAAAGDHVEMVFRVISAKTKQPVPGLEISIEGSRSFGKLGISPEGFFTIPLDEAALRDGAEFVTNQKKGSLELGLVLRPRLPSAGMRYSMVVDSLTGARKALHEIVPWYLRIFVPGIKALGICYAQDGGRVEIAGEPPRTIEATAGETDDRNAPVHCVRLTGRGESIPPDALIVPSSGWIPLFLGS